MSAKNLLKTDHEYLEVIVFQQLCLSINIFDFHFFIASKLTSNPISKTIRSVYVPVFIGCYSRQQYSRRQKDISHSRDRQDSLSRNTILIKTAEDLVQVCMFNICAYKLPEKKIKEEGYRTEPVIISFLLFHRNKLTIEPVACLFYNIQSLHIFFHKLITMTSPERFLHTVLNSGQAFLRGIPFFKSQTIQHVVWT